MALGVPGPTGATGATGAAGTNGTNGVGVAAGGLVNQALVKLSSADYDTGWATITSGGGTWGSITGTLSSQTDLQNALNAKLSLTGGTMVNGSTILVSSTPDIDNQGTKSTFNSNGVSAIYYSEGGAVNTYITNYGNSSIDHTFFDNPQNFHLNQNGVYGIGDGEVSWGVGIGGITFPDSSVQTTAGLPLTGGTMSGQIAFESVGTALDIRDGGAIRFGVDDSYQTTAFPPTGGTSSQYIDGTGALQTYGPLGDRYLTSSTSTLTCDSGNGKTMTVGTGLSYSRQQDITVSYDTANHMHGTVLTYNSTTGVMTFDSNTHSGGGTYSNWQVNVGGVAGAVLPVGGSAGQVLAKINSTNFNTEWISLGSMAQATTTDYLAKADNLSGLASTITARTNLGLGAVATDSYATTAQAQAGTSTTTVINPSTLLDARYLAGARFAGYTTWTASTSGTGASAGTAFTKSVTAPTSATGFGQSYTALQNGQRGQIFNTGIDFSKNIVFGGRFCRLTSGTVDSNSIFRCNLGRSVPITTAGDLSSRGVGIRIVGNTGVVELQVHNGTTLYNVASSFTPVYNQAFDVVIISNGSGTATLYINGTSVATSSNAPTTLLSANFSVYLVECQNTATLSNSAMSMNCSDQFLHISPI
jgi:hypothetical protein